MKNIDNPMDAFIVDVDGVMTTGHFIYSSQGKDYKIFGPDDNDALSLLSKHVKIEFVTGDRKGFAISERRIVHDMGYKLSLVSTTERTGWLREKFNLEKVIYMGDGIFDHFVMKNVAYSIAPANADYNARQYSNYVTKRGGGDRAVAEACLHILEKFFIPFDPDQVLDKALKYSGKW